MYPTSDHLISSGLEPRKVVRNNESETDSFPGVDLITPPPPPEGERGIVFGAVC